MDWIDDEVNRRLNDGTHNCASVFDVIREGKQIRKEIEQEERTRVLEEENNMLLKKQLTEAKESNVKLEKHNAELMEVNKKLEIQIRDFKEESKSNRKRSNVSLAVSIISTAIAVVAIVVSALTR